MGAQLKPYFALGSTDSDGSRRISAKRNRYVSRRRCQDHRHSCQSNRMDRSRSTLLPPSTASTAQIKRHAESDALAAHRRSCARHARLAGRAGSARSVITPDAPTQKVEEKQLFQATDGFFREWFPLRFVARNATKTTSQRGIWRDRDRWTTNLSGCSLSPSVELL